MLTTRLSLLCPLLLLLLVSGGGGAAGAAPAAAAAAPGGEPGAADRFAAQAADAIDNTLLSFKNGLSSMFEDGSKLSTFFANVTTHFKRLAGQDKDAAS